MHRTEGANKTADNKFTDGPPGTTVNDDWLNAVQEEIANVIESAGLVLKTAATETNLQLREALLKTVPMPRGYISGLIMSNNIVDANHDIDIAVGKCRDAGDAESILFTTAMTKQIDANWAAGTNQGGFPSGLGAVAPTTWYYVFVIAKADGTVDAGFDTSLLATNLLADAADYIYYRIIGSVLTDGASDIIGFLDVEMGNGAVDREWNAKILETNGVAFGAARQTLTVTCPPNTINKTFVYVNKNAIFYMWIASTSFTDVVPAVDGPLDIYTDASGAVVSIHKNIAADSSSQIAFRYTINPNILNIISTGYIDGRVV